MRCNVFFLTIGILSVILLTGCNREEDLAGITDISVTTFHAVIEAGVTKTVLENGDSETQSHPVLWTPGDAIGITSATDFKRYEYKGTENTSSADFVGEKIQGSLFYAVYPYNTSAAMSGTVLSLDLPAVQEYAEESFAPVSSPMVARSGNAELEFKNLCGLLKLNLTGSETVKSITFRSDGKGVSGRATVDMNYENVPELVMAEDASTSVTLDCGDGVTLNGSASVPFYIVLPAGRYEEFSIVITSAEGGVMTKSSSELVINRSMVRPTSDLEFIPDEIVGDREALIAFYNATGGQDWVNSTNWCTDEPLDTWYGITTDDEGRVTRISMMDNRITGPAGKTLAPLTKLTYINFNYNVGQQSDWNRLTSIDLSGNKLLDTLCCSMNELTELDLSANTNLIYLFCWGNKLTELNLGNNKVLTDVYCYQNELSALDVSQNGSLKSLDCRENNLSTVDVSSNSELVSLDCGYNNLTDLDVSMNVALTSLSFFNNNLHSIDVSKNTALVSLDCRGNGLLSLDLSNNTDLKYLNCDDNSLTSLDVSSCTDLSSLNCCRNQLSSLDVSGNKKLTSLQCYENNLTTLEVNNGALEYLTCSQNLISSLKLSENVNMTFLQCYSNMLESLDVSNSVLLEYLDCGGNRIASLDVSAMPSLYYLSCSNNQLSSLDVSNNKQLELLYCDYNSLSSLDVSNNVLLTHFYCKSNYLASLDIRNNANLGTDLEVGNQREPSTGYAAIMRLLLSEEQLADWNNIWSMRGGNEYVTVSTEENWFEVSPAEFDVPATGGEIKVYVSTDQDYTVNIANPEWISLISGTGVKEGEVVFLVDENTVAAERIGMVQFCAGASCYNVEVRQAAGTDASWVDETFYHRSLAMRFTADWCGYCPNMADGFDLAQEQVPDKIEVVSYHEPGSGLSFSPTSILMSQYGVVSFPTGIVDGRTLIENYDKSVIASSVIDAMNETESNYPTASGISFSSSISGQVLSAYITLYLKSAGDYKVTVVVLEDGIVGSQANYYTGDTYDYVHDGVARIALSDISGDAFSAEADNVTRTFSYNALIPSEYNKDNLRILVYVQRAYGSQAVISSGDYGEYYIDNCASGKAGENLDLMLLVDTVGGGNEDFGNDDRYEW